MAILRRAAVFGAGALAGAGAALWWAGGRRPEGATIRGGAEGAVLDGDLRVATWNIHYGYGPVFDRGSVGDRATVVQNLERIAALLRDERVDIAALQEVDLDAKRSFGIDQLAWLRRATGLQHAAWTETWNVRWVPSPGRDPRKQWGQARSGQATLSRFPLKDAVRHALPQPAGNGKLYNHFYLHRAGLECTVVLGGGRAVRVINVHTEAFDRKNCEEHAEILAGLVRDNPRHTLLLGDFNTAPPEAALRHAFPDEPQTDMREDRSIPILRSVPGMREVVTPERYVADEAAWFSFPAWEPNRRLDYLFYGEGLALREARVLRGDASDHLPIVGRFEVEVPSS